MYIWAPRCSILAFLLFVFYVHDLDLKVGAVINTFAEDTRIGSVVDSEERSFRVQKDSNELVVG